MPSRLHLSHALEAIRTTLQSFPEGATAEEIAAALTFFIEPWSLRRRLKTLQEDGSVEITGRGRGTRYRLLSTPAPVAEAPSLPFSRNGADIMRLVTRTIQARRPVGYQHAFLDSYQPNITAYLTPSEKERLRLIGKTPMTGHAAGTYAKDILHRLLIDLSWNSSRLEGNTYSLLDTQRLIDLGEVAEGKSAADAQMILNHKEAIEFLVQQSEDIGFNRYTILNLHGILSQNLLPDPQASGRLRNMPVGIAHSVYTPLAVPQLIDECFNLILAKAATIADPFEQALFAMVQLPYLQPFNDVNKRVSRLAANISLLRHNLAPLSFIDVPDSLYIQAMLGVYELNRIDLLKDVFMWAYQRSADRYVSIRQSVGAPDPFRLRYRNAIYALVANVVTRRCNQKNAASLIAAEAQSLAQKDQTHFIEVVETELLALHEGNYARYHIRPSEFEAWQKVWQKKEPG